MSATICTRETKNLVEELKKASARPLYVELALARGVNAQMHAEDPSINIAPPRPWKKVSTSISTYRSNILIKILKDIVGYVPYFSESELIELLDIGAILLLGFLLPYSTGNDFQLLSYSRANPSTDDDIPDFVARVSLEDRMEASVRIFQLNNTPGPSIYGRLTDQDWAFEFSELLEILGELLQARPIPCEAVDLIHLFAMAIHPIPPALAVLPSRATKHPSAQRAQTLMRHLVSPQFFLLDCHRQAMLKLVSECLVFPDLAHEYEPGSSPFLYGAWRHLLQSVLAADPYVEVDLARLAVQLRHVDLALKPLWDYYLNELIESNGTRCFFCSGSNEKARGCLFMRRAERLAFCLRGDPPEAFRQHALRSLSEAIEWQYECNLDNEENKDEAFPPCLLAALLKAAIPLGHNESIVHKAVHLLSHPERSVVKESTKLLTAAMQGMEQLSWIEEDLLHCLNSSLWPEECTSLVARVSNLSRAIAGQLLDAALDRKQGSNDEKTRNSWIVAIASNAPVEATKEAMRIREKVGDPSRPSFQICEALLSMRLAFFFPTNDYLENRRVVEAVFASSSLRNLWDRYKLAKHAMTTGCYEFSASSLDQLQQKLRQEKSYVWMSFLQKISSGEAMLTQEGALGIPGAVRLLSAARKCAGHLDTYERSVWSEGSDFHVDLLSLRIDFLRLTGVLRSIAMECQLTGNLPKKNTRAFLHLRNLRRAFNILSARYEQLIHWNGACFHHRQSLWALKLLGKEASFMGRMTSVVFSECLSTERASKAKARYQSDDAFVCKGNHPVAVLLNRMEKEVIQELDASTEIDLRASALLQLLDAIVRVPVSLPRDFFRPVEKAPATIKIVTDGVATSAGSKILEVMPMISSALTVTGEIPNCYLQYDCSRTIVLWLELSVDESVDQGDTNVQMLELPDLSKVSPMSTPLLPKGGFFSEILLPPFTIEGSYVIAIKLGLRDGRNKWAVPTDNETVKISVRRS